MKDWSDETPPPSFVDPTKKPTLGVALWHAHHVLGVQDPDIVRAWYSDLDAALWCDDEGHRVRNWGRYLTKWINNQHRDGNPRVQPKATMRPRRAKSTRFVPPTEAEVRAFCREREYILVDPVEFVAFYESKGWMVGKNKMKSWHAAARRWHFSNLRGNTDDPRLIGQILHEKGVEHDESDYLFN